MAQNEPSKMTLLNLDDPTSESFVVMYNPDVHTWRGTAEYSKKKAIGATSEVSHFIGNPDETLSLILWFDVLDQASHLQLDSARNFLTSLIRPGRNPQSIAENTPPDVLLTWPGVRSSVVKVTSFEAMEDFFDKDGNPLRHQIQLNFFEVFVERLTYNDVLENGYSRAGSSEVIFI